MTVEDPGYRLMRNPGQFPDIIKPRGSPRCTTLLADADFGYHKTPNRIATISGGFGPA
jgi:hypothetical protein